ncbi:MAG: SGNH/GDSL hydrolase family protein, partial [Deltaproteobacteria bacterium]|nr:SGNH/GDSL hydrolase family protein [Deltaproteobacteria bacterium]
MDEEKRRRVKLLVALCMVALGFCIWLFPSNVVELIAKQRDVLLGRYSMDRFSTFFVLTPVLWLVAYSLWASTKMSARQVGFRIAALLFSVLLAALAIEPLGRLVRKPRYVEKKVEEKRDWKVERVEGIVRHRPPNRVYKIRYADLPPTARSYPKAPPGYPAVDITLSIDGRGYRNQRDDEQYDIVTVGDSFTEGSRVSDHEAWPSILDRRLNQTVYNLGISGGRPDRYLSVFRVYGLALRPKIAVFMIYEGNDFKRITFKKGPSSQDKPFHKKIRETVKSSPVVKGLKKFFIRSLGPVRADAPVPGAEILSWMPVAAPPGKEAKYYAFQPKRLMRLYWTETDFRKSPEWTTNARVFKMIKELCRKKGVRLVFAYAPAKPHVVMPLVKAQSPRDKLHAFASLEERGLPRPAEFKRLLYERLGSQEKVMRGFCEREGIGFVSVTRAL